MNQRIQGINTNVNPRLIIAYDPRSPEAEAYRTLRTNVFHIDTSTELKTLLITSTRPGEGKTTTVANLAITVAEIGKSVVLVDSDMRRPSLHYLFGINKSPGLAEILQGKIEWADALRNPGVENLNIIPSGEIPPNPSELIGSKKMELFLNELKERFDVVLFDACSVLAVTDAAILAALTDGVLMVVMAEKTPREAILRALTLLKNVNSRLLGVVFNGVDIRRSHTYYYYYRYEADSGSKPGKKRK